MNASEQPESKPSEGWGTPHGSRKFHYFRGSMSLCRRWGLYFGPLQPDDGNPGSEDCRPCREALDKSANA